SSTYYKESLKNDEKEILLPKEMTKKLYDNIIAIGRNEYFENELLGIDFECDITLDDLRNIDDSPQKISRKIADLIGNSDGYYYIYLNTYYSKKAVELYMF
ncbi:13981_t:CDS:1, partial [Dentiscutata erythropus]